MERFADLPVAVDLPAPLADEVAAAVETELGWQVVDAAGPPTPALLLCAAPVAGRPCVVVADGPIPAEAVRAALLAGAVDVVAWPEQRALLGGIPRRLGGRLPTTAGGAPPDAGPALRRIAGAAGGVGTSTVALAVGGLAAWGGRRAIVVGGEDLLRLCGVARWTGPGAAQVSLLAPEDAAAEVAVLARPVAGVDGLAVLGGGGASVRDVSGWPADLVVVDAGVLRSEADVVVARPDVGLRALEDGAEAVLVAGDGPLPRRVVRRVLGPRLTGWLPWSARVARAGLVGAVPGALPGSWLAALRTALARGTAAPR